MFCFTVKTFIKQQDFLKVFNQFDEQLFLYLTKNQPIKLLHFGGSKPKHEIRLLFPFRQLWVSVITKERISEQQAYFIDEGKTLPFGITYWEHQHLVEKAENGCYIIDKIHYNTNHKLLSYLLFFPLFLPVYFRKSRYKKYFFISNKSMSFS